jgi:hypothetical protein
MLQIILILVMSEKVFLPGVARIERLFMLESGLVLPSAKCGHLLRGGCGKFSHKTVSTCAGHLLAINTTRTRKAKA